MKRTIASIVAATLGLYVLGFPVELSGVAFVVLTAGATLLARPLFGRFGPRFETADDE